MDNEISNVMSLMFNYPTRKFHIREIARITGLHPNTVIKEVKELKKKGFVIVEKKKHVVEVRANIDNSDFLWSKRIYSLSKIYESGIIGYLVSEFEPELISLIGSYSRGEDIEKSDIDLVVVSSKKNRADIHEYEKKLGKNVHLLIIGYKDISNEFYTNLINGVVLYGFVRKI